MHKLVDQRFKTNSSVSTKVISNKPDPQLTREAQRLLTDLGYNPGPIDGDYGRGTANAIMAFQRYMNIKQDGLINQSLVLMLRQAVAKKIHNLHLLGLFSVVIMLNPRVLMLTSMERAGTVTEVTESQEVAANLFNEMNE